MQYIYDDETRQWLTPEQRIEEELQAIAEQAKADGHVETEEAIETDAQEKLKTKKKKKRKSQASRWINAKENTWAYVVGLPLDISVDEIANAFSKCGVIQMDLHTGKPRIKLYRNKETGKLNV